MVLIEWYEIELYNFCVLTRRIFEICRILRFYVRRKMLREELQMTPVSPSSSLSLSRYSEI